MKKKFLDSIEVKSPCHKSWDQMTGNDEVRFCSHCAKDVHNLSQMTRRKAEKLIKNSNGKLCVRYVKDPNGTLITAPPKLVSITRRSALAAGVLATSLALSTMTYAQGQPEPIKTKVHPVRRSKDATKQVPATISGQVTDVRKAVIANAKVILKDTGSNKIQTTQTNHDGFYQFSQVEPSIYEITFEAGGFEKLILKKIEFLKDSKLYKTGIFRVAVMEDAAIIGTVSAEIGRNITDQDVQNLNTSQPSLVELINVLPTPPEQAARKQEPATISGTVKDAGEELVPIAKVTLRNIETDRIRVIQIKDKGTYEFTDVEPGKYELTVESLGFKKSVYRNLEIQKGSKLEMNLVLEVGGVICELPMVTPSEQSTRTAVTAENRQGLSVISGIVKDRTGAVVGGVKVILFDVKNNKAHGTQTNDEGVYEFVEVEPSVYRIEAERPGFKKLVLKEFKVKQNKKLAKHLTLEIGVLMGEVVLVEQPLKAQKKKN